MHRTVHKLVHHCADNGDDDDDGDGDDDDDDGDDDDFHLMAGPMTKEGGWLDQNHDDLSPNGWVEDKGYKEEKAKDTNDAERSQE